MSKTSVVIPNWNGEKDLGACLNSLRAQTASAEIIVVDNASSDGSVSLVESKYPRVTLLHNRRNLGFTGGVNTGIRHSMEQGSKYIALFNNDAVADKQWLQRLVNYLDKHPKVGIATSRILDSDRNRLDSSGDLYTIWGLPYPRGRGELARGKYQESGWVFSGSGAASLYRAKMLQEIGLFDQDFFAYYEDVDISFRAQLAGWRVAYVTEAVAYHKIGTSSAKLKNFATYQTLKNLPMLMWKNVPLGLLPKVWPRFEVAYSMIAFRALARGQFGAFFKGTMAWGILWPKKFVQRYKIQRHRKVSNEYIWSVLTHDLPPNAHKLRKMRMYWWKLRGKDV